VLKKISMALLVSGFCIAQLQAAGVGAQSASWMRIPVDVRSSAMAGSLSAAVDDADALNINPAGLALMRGTSLSFSHSFWAQDLSLEHAAFGYSTNGVGLAASGNYLDFGAIDQFSVGSSGLVSDGTFTPQALDFSFGGALKMGNGIYLGVAANWTGQNLSNSWDSAISGNLGILYRNEGGFSAAAALLNAGQTLENYSLPLQVSAGAAFSSPLSRFSPDLTDHSVTIAGQWDYLPNSSFSSFSIGGEYWYRQFLAVRAGYRFSDYGTTDGLHGLTLGAGARLSNFELSYALVTLGSLGNSNQLSVSFNL